MSDILRKKKKYEALGRLGYLASDISGDTMGETLRARHFSDDSAARGQ